jgi:DNA-binding response OmpR family regulator
MIRTNVLVVEDEMMIAWQVRDLLEDLGFEAVQTVGKFEDALAVAERSPPTLLICDVNLGSGPDGIATASAIASHKVVEVIFITGYAGDEIRSRVERFDPGAKLLRKPIQAKFLKDAILQVLGRKPN